MNFVIITPGRSGSEALKQMLQDQSVPCLGEVFNRSQNKKGEFHKHLREDIHLRVLSWMFNREKISSSNWNWPIRFLISSFLRNFAISTGFKLSLDQWEAYPHALQYCSKHQWKFIYLSRKDKLALVLSLIKARKTTNYDQPDKSSLHVTPDEVIGLMTKLRSLEQELLKAFEIDVHLSYEEMIAEPQSVVQKVLKCLGHSTSKRIQLKTIKVNPDRLEEWVPNLDEIKSAVNQ